MNILTVLLNLMSAQDAHIDGHNNAPLVLEANYKIIREYIEDLEDLVTTVR